MALRAIDFIYETQRDLSVALINKELNKLDPRINRVEFLETLCNVERYVGKPTYNGLLTLPMDTYLLLRLFTSFDKSKMSRGPRYCQDDYYSTPRHIIVYVGGMHVIIYNEFIKSFFNTQPEISISSDMETKYSSCITLSKPLMFFEN